MRAESVVTCQSAFNPCRLPASASACASGCHSSRLSGRVKAEINMEPAARFHDHAGLWKPGCLEEARDRVDGVVGSVVTVLATFKIDVKVERLERDHVLLVADRR